MKRYAILILFIAFFRFLTAQNLDIQIKRLEHLQRMIDEKRNLINNTRVEKSELQGNRINYENRLQETQRQLHHLSSQELDLAQEIARSLSDSELTQLQIKDVSDLFQKQLSNLYYNHCLHLNKSENIIADQYLPILINHTKSEIDNNKKLLAFIKDSLENNRASQRRIQREKQEATKVSQSVNGQLTKLSHKIDNLSQQELNYLQEFQSLENSRAALEEMITQIQSDLSRQKFSYQFTNPKLLWPVKGSVVTNFGNVYDEKYKITTINNGIEIQCTKPQEVLSVDYGIVVYAEFFRSYGKLIIIDHQNGYFSLYGNNGSLLVTKDEKVSLGQPIAIAGRKDNHYNLHFELRKHNVPIDPRLYLE